MDTLLATILNSEVSFENYKRPNSNKIYHYTSQEAMMSIVENNSFYASNALFLNDSSELKYGRELIKNVIDKLLNSKEYEFKRKHFTKKGISLLNRTLKEIDNHSITNIYVVCFSRSNDLLSQWRGYGENGIQIELLSDELHYCFDTNFISRDIIYQRKEQEKNIIEEIEVLINFAVFGTDWGPSLDKDDLPNFPSSLARTLLNSTVWFKDSAWKEEKEYRIVYSANSKNKKILETKFRTNGRYLIPFVEMKANKSELPIKEFKVSPSINQERLYQGLKLFIKTIGKDIKVTKSKISYIK